MTATLDDVISVSRDRGLAIVEDCAQAFGSRWHGRPLGSIGDVGCFSFQQRKVLNCGEGGAACTTSTAIAGRLYAFHNPFDMVGAPAHDHVAGSNSRTTCWQAAILRCQLERLDAQIAMRASRLRHLASRLQDVSGFHLVQPPAAVTTWNGYDPLFRFDAALLEYPSKTDVVGLLRAAGVPAEPGHVDPVYTWHSYPHSQVGHRNDGCPTAERLSRFCFAIRHHLFLGPEEWMDRLCEVLTGIAALRAAQ
jgi:dTDP-4-amino-4,6-dideoxygalactose transaminase